jgi:hypothetical protein
MKLAKRKDLLMKGYIPGDVYTTRGDIEALKPFMHVAIA